MSIPITQSFTLFSKTGFYWVRVRLVGGVLRYPESNVLGEWTWASIESRYSYIGLHQPSYKGVLGIEVNWTYSHVEEPER